MSTSRTTPLVAQIWEEESLVVMARIRSIAGTLVTQASLTSIACAVYDADTLITSPTVTVASAISDTLVTADTRWTLDATGYNFVFTLSGVTCFPNPNKLYRVQFIFTATTGHKSYLVVTVRTRDLAGQ